MADERRVSPLRSKSRENTTPAKSVRFSDITPSRKKMSPLRKNSPSPPRNIKSNHNNTYHSPGKVNVIDMSHKYRDFSPQSKSPLSVTRNLY